MTVVFSGASDQLIAMTVDSAVTRHFATSFPEYETGNKAYPFDGVGCVATWGARDCNRIGDFLQRQSISSASHSITDLVNLVYDYLTQEYRPAEMGLEDAGYHIAGFDKEGHPRLYHVFWGFDRPKPPGQLERKYDKYEHSPSPGAILLLFNGRNDLAEKPVHTLLEQIRAGNESRFDLSDPLDLARFGDFVARFAAELTPEVGPPFHTHLFSPVNRATKISNSTFCPIDRGVVKTALNALGY